MLPVFLYCNYLSGINLHSLPPIESVQYASWWLIVGLVYLYFFTKNDAIIVLYFLVSIFTIGIHLYYGGHFVDSFRYFQPIVVHPLFLLIAFFFPTYFIWKVQQKRENALLDTLHSNHVSLNRVLQTSSLLICRLSAERDVDGNVVHLRVDKVNNAFEAAFKRNSYELVGQEANYVFGLIFKGELDINQLLFFNRKNTYEFHASKLEQWFKIQVVNAKFNQYYIIFEDISASQKKIADLEANKKRYKVLLEAIPDIFFVIDKDGIYEDFVIKESDVFKVEDVDIIGSSIFNAGFPDNMANKIYSCIQACIKNNSIETIEYGLNTPNGTFLFEMRLAKLNSNAVISIARDITKRKTAEFNLDKALKRAEESDRLKSAFLSNLSHEIRTPMNIITNFTRMLTDPEISQKERIEISDAVMENGKQLMNMIDNTVHLSRIETEDIKVNHQFSNINAVVRNIYNEFSPNLPDSKDLRIKIDLDVPNSEFGFSTDEKLLSNALSILVDNAVKYTPSGLVTLGYKMVLNNHVKFIVSDTGIGIPEEEYEHIFSRFYRISNTVNQNTSGSGIGLSIAQHYVALLGGELQFESTKNKGTTFWFSLPFIDGKGYMAIIK